MDGAQLRDATGTPGGKSTFNRIVGEGELRQGQEGAPAAFGRLALRDEYAVPWWRRNSMTESREYPTRPFIGVGVVVLKDDFVLLIERAKPPKAGEWSLPGGSQDGGEPVRHTAARRVREETWITIAEPRFLEVTDAIIPDVEGRVQFHYTLVDFWAEWAAGEPFAADDAKRAEWIALSRVDELSMWEKTREIIKKAVAMRGNAWGNGD